MAGGHAGQRYLQGMQVRQILESWSAHEGQRVVIQMSGRATRAGGGYIYSLCKDGTIFWIVLYWSLTGITLNFMCVFLLRGKAAHGAKDKSELLVCCSLVLHGSQQGVVMEGPFRYWVNVVAVKPTGRRKTRNTWSWYTVCTSKKQTRPDVNIQRVQY